MDHYARKFTDERAERFHAERVAAAQQLERAHQLIAGLPIFAALDDRARWRLAQQAREHRFDSGSLVLIEGDETDGFYVIRSGTADVMRSGASGLVPIAQLDAGSYFGELGLLAETRRGATVIAGRDEPLEVLAFDAQTFHEIIAEHVLIFRMQRARKHLQQVQHVNRATLAQLPPFSSLGPEDLTFVLDAAREDEFDRDETIFEQGARGDRFYVLLRGALEIERDGDRIATLAAGEFFGETALLFTRRRTATVRTLLPSTVWSITRRAFGRMVKRELLLDPESFEILAQRRAA